MVKGPGQCDGSMDGWPWVEVTYRIGRFGAKKYYSIGSINGYQQDELEESSLTVSGAKEQLPIFVPPFECINENGFELTTRGPKCNTDLCVDAGVCIHQ